MVNIVFTVVSLLVLVVAVVTKSQTSAVLPNQTETEVLSATSQETPIETASPSPTPTPTPTNTPMVTATASATPKPTVQSTAQTSISEWVYTGQISDKSQTEDALSFTTTDDPKTVTAWYKQKMTTLGFSTKSVIQTQSNAKVLNKIAGSGERGSVAIEIAEDSKNAPTHVTVTLDISTRSSDVHVSVNNSI